MAAAPRLEGAGEQGKLCYRRACQKPGAHYYNTQTKKFYCLRCASLINSGLLMRGEDRVCILLDEPLYQPETDDSSGGEVAADTSDAGTRDSASDNGHN